VIKNEDQRYTALKERYKNGVDNFRIFFAFIKKQFDEGMAKLGFSPDDVDKVYVIPGTGRFTPEQTRPVSKRCLTHMNVNTKKQ
jgi:hypothetical protein